MSRMIAAGAPLPIIAKIGWSAGTMAKMAARYGHFGIEELRSAVESISRTSELNAGTRKIPRSQRPTMKPSLTNLLSWLVGARGFEPPTPCAQGRCATRLRYAPTVLLH